jgi:hypothetical protein
MLQSLMAIRRTFRSYRPPPPAVLPEPEPKPAQEVTQAPVLFYMTADMATPPDLMPVSVVHRYTVREVLQVVCDVWEVEMVELISARRSLDVMWPRKAAYALACKFTLRSLPEIGRHVGGRDHATVLSGKNRMQPLMDRVRDKIRPDASLRQWAETLRIEVDAFDAALRSTQSERTRARRRRP